MKVYYGTLWFISVSPPKKHVLMFVDLLDLMKFLTLLYKL